MTEEEKKERQREINRKAVQKYREKTVSFAVKYSAVDAEEGKRLKSYLERTGQSANSYIKSLIKKDLDDKNVYYIDDEGQPKYNLLQAIKEAGEARLKELGYRDIEDWKKHHNYE
mgnify:FL=1